MKKLAIPLTLALLTACASITAGRSPAMMKDGMLVNANGMTLYTFDRDVTGSGKSACNGDCAARWPAALASDSDRPGGDYTIVMRDNGQKQWAYRGRPLYLWVQDQKPGDKKGDNFNNVWHIVQ